jgi:uncharacterized DUF497 family protein
MGPVLRWHPQKARSNLQKHGLTFEEAASVFRDTLSVTISDSLHATEEDRFVTIGRSGEIERWSWYIRKSGIRFESLAPDSRPGRNGESMRRARSRQEPEEMLPEYDFSGGVRGKYAGRFTKDTIMVVLDPDVAEVFPDPKSVNKALRALGHIIRDCGGKTERRRRAEG